MSGNAEMGTRWYICLATRFRTLWWVALAGLTAVVILTVLVPFYGSGLHPPAMPWGTFAFHADERAALASFGGTLWSSALGQQLFWNVGCFGWCVWLPALYLVGVTIVAPARPLSPRAKRAQGLGIGLCALVGILWLIATLGFYEVSIPD